ncbi:hypothetical protein A7982_12925 [Minicystis rosea]|nr:hypothetical protein A7982_12925 [Minicystis rosea]
MVAVIAVARARQSPLAGRDPRGERRIVRAVGIARVVRSALHRMFAITVAALVVVSALTAGRSYLWCSMMERAVEACCCEPEHDAFEAPAGGEPEVHSACCEDRLHAAFDKARVSRAAVEVPDVLPVSVAAPAIVRASASAAPAFAPARPSARVRAGPIRAGPRSAAETCVRLQVFHC